MTFLEDFLINHKIVDGEMLRKNSKQHCILAGMILGNGNISYIDSNWKCIELKVGRYLTRFYPGFSPKEITHICEKYKSFVETPKTFKIIEGDELKESYYLKNYVPNNGTLSNSCMRYKKCQNKDFFKIYGDNAKMLIMVPNRGRRLLGRAILWEIDGKIIMDRVYSIENYVEHQFYNYAKSKNWIILNRNSYTCSCQHDSQNWLIPEDNYTTPISLNFTLQLKEKCKNYPFMDSFCYLNKEENVLSTFPFVDGYRLQTTCGYKYAY